MSKKIEIIDLTKESDDESHNSQKFKSKKRKHSNSPKRKHKTYKKSNDIKDLIVFYYNKLENTTNSEEINNIVDALSQISLSNITLQLLKDTGIVEPLRQHKSTNSKIRKLLEKWKYHVTQVQSSSSPIQVQSSSSPTQVQLREYKKEDGLEENKTYIKFYSGGKLPMCKLSNFYHVKENIKYDGILYPTTEHAFQAQKYIPEQRIRFSIQGDLGQIDSGFNLVFNVQDVDKKKIFWMQKHMFGVVAKMATDEKRGKKLGLTRNKDFQSTDKLWIDILSKKYEIEEYKDLLKSTGNKYLLEFSKSAKRLADKTFWAGLIDNETHELYGNNQMGKYIMYIRSII
jgi:predicted NAD-dependent protein-ADP-ribosyltransferase YbiA (DUF1768 family)